MDGHTIRRLTGWAAVGMMVFWAAQFPLYLVNDPSVGMYDGAGGAAEAYRIRNIIFTRILLDLGLYAAAMVFAAGLGYLIRRADPGYEWAASLVVASMAVWVGVTLVATGLEGGLALDAMAPDPDPSVNRALTMGYLLIYNSSIAFAITGLFLGAAGWAAAATGVLPRWTRWVAYVGVLSCAAAVPSMYGGPLDPAGFYNAAGWGPVIIANLPPAVWVVIAAVLLLRRSAPASSDRRTVKCWWFARPGMVPPGKWLNGWPTASGSTAWQWTGRHPRNRRRSSGTTRWSSAARSTQEIDTKPAGRCDVQVAVVA